MQPILHRYLYCYVVRGFDRVRNFSLNCDDLVVRRVLNEQLLGEYVRYCLPPGVFG